ncbi:MAG: phosphatidate cytidylyltransferase [Chitinophagia bacterium]|jgi:phosphatidate cytidylyltransferase
MSFDFKVFRVRALSAIVFAGLMVGGLFWNKWSFFALFFVIQLGCLYEYQKLVALIKVSYASISSLHKYGLLLLGTLVMIRFGSVDISINDIGLPTIANWCLPFVLGAMLISDIATKKFKLQNWALSMAGLIYISLSLALFFQLKKIMSSTFIGDWGFSIPLILVATIWVNDTLAYLVGSLIGKKPLSSISPNKTWEGTIAGVFIAVLFVSKIMGMYLPIQEKYILMISVTAAIAGTFGDLLQSKLKRLAQVKDSGKMMPGHGGFLDRFDSILLASPFVWLILQLLF